MFNFNLKPGHANPADGLLDAVGAFDVTGKLVAGHTNSADGLLVAQLFYQPVEIGSAPAVQAITATALNQPVTFGTAKLKENIRAAALDQTVGFGTATLSTASPTYTPPIGGGVHWNSPRRRPRFDAQAEEDELIAVTLNHFLNN